MSRHQNSSNFYGRKFDYCVYMVPPMDSVLCQMKPGIILILSFSDTPFNDVLFSTPLSTKYYLSLILFIPCLTRIPVCP